MRTLHLFAGAGGGLLADLILGHTPIAAVEWDAYCCQVLRERAEEGWFPGLRVHEGDVRLFDPSEYAGRVDCIHAGFPCQDISNAGKRAGIGSEGYVAVQMGRRFVGAELKASYYQQAARNLATAKAQTASLFDEVAA